MNKILFCYGTRPEFIKIAPVVDELKKYSKLETLVICSGQHEELLEGLSQIFAVENHFDLKVRAKIGKSTDLNSLTSSLISSFSKKFKEIKPTAVLVQGDAASAFCAALASFQLGIPIFYIEAGLRTDNLSAPFPEEGYRQMISRIASLYFAPTKINLENLVSEKISKSKIHIVGNTVIDALAKIRKDLEQKNITNFLEKEIPQLKKRGERKLVVVELHRREIYGKPLVQVLDALKEIQIKNPDYFFIFPAHPSPGINPVVNNTLGRKKGFAVIQAPNYLTFIALVNLAVLVITDSGGIQEELPSFGIPVMVVREKTERIEGLVNGWSVLTGFEKDKIVEAFESLKNWQKPKGGNPYGDGKSSQRIAKIIYEYFF